MKKIKKQRRIKYWKFYTEGLDGFDHITILMAKNEDEALKKLKIIVDYKLINSVTETYET